MSGSAGRWGSTDVTLTALQTEASRAFLGYPWEGVARLVDRSPSIHDLRAHRLELLAAARRRERGLPVPSELTEDVRLADLSTLTAIALVKRIRDVCSGPLLLFKGLEAAAQYPAPTLRPFGDVDVLVPDAEAVQRQLLAAGFRPVGPELEWETLHHLPRLAAPDLPFAVEVHRRPKCVVGIPGPRVDELLGSAVPSATGVDGVLAPAPSAHAVLLAAHAWAERPLRCIGDLVDVATVADGVDRGEVDEIAHRSGLDRVWRATVRAADSLFRDQPTPWQLRTWARHLRAARGQTVLAHHVERVLMPFSAFAPLAAVKTAGHDLVLTVQPEEGEDWGAKLDRTQRAARNAFKRRSDHRRSLRDRRGRP